MSAPNLLHLNTDTLRDIQLHLRSRGLLHLASDAARTPYTIAITAAPTPIKYDDYLAVKSLQPSINLMLDNLSRDKEFIISNLTGVAAHDPLCKGLLDIYTSLPDPPDDQITLGLFRHDYMYATDDPNSPTAHLHGQFNMVEFNMSAACLGSLCDGVYRYHQSVLNRSNHDTGSYAGEVGNVQGYCEGLCRAHDLYKAKHKSMSCVVVMVLEDKYEFNYFDQQILLNAVEERGVPTARYATQYLVEHGTVQQGRFYIDEREVSVFYFRTMYHPKHFPGQEYWDLRRDMEHSAAVTVPTIPHQIVNMKLFQMLLSQREVLERYTDSVQTTDALLGTFCATLPLNLDDAGNKNAKLGLENPDEYVLKPQREGGGNNYYGSEMVDKLRDLRDDPARCSFILMKKITPPHLLNKFVRNGVISDPIETVSEIGYFSVYCTQGDRVLLNSVAGPVVRTKDTNANEGGVAVGISCVDSPYFV